MKGMAELSAQLMANRQSREDARIEDARIHDILQNDTVAITLRLSWRSRDGSRSEYSLGPFGGKQEQELRVRFALMCISAGWTPAYWWKFWRWGDASPKYMLDVYSEVTKH